MTVYQTWLGFGFRKEFAAAALVRMETALDDVLDRSSR